jgi:ubiquitin thioesterase protein OTUB1
LTSAELQKNPDAYAGFIVHPETQQEMPVVDFCHMFVEGMGKEAGQSYHPLPLIETNVEPEDHVQMQALSRAMSVNLSVAYLDGTLGDKGEAAVGFVEFENGGGEEANGLEDVVLLYRWASHLTYISQLSGINADFHMPGHYDILEHRASEHERSTASTLVTPSVME